MNHLEKLLVDVIEKTPELKPHFDKLAEMLEEAHHKSYQMASAEIAGLAAVRIDWGLRKIAGIEPKQDVVDALQATPQELYKVVSESMLGHVMAHLANIQGGQQDKSDPEDFEIGLTKGNC